MVSPPTPVHPENKGNAPKSRFRKTVCLADWWLVQTENDLQGIPRLAVAGFTCRENQGMRVFSSAPILKRHDVFTIETADGICVIFKGFMNRARTLGNGFPSDVCNHFVFGFPPYWKEYEENFIGKKSSSNDISGSKIEIGQPRAENCENNLESQCKIDVKRVHKKMLAKNSDSVIIGSECNLTMPCIAPESLEDESNSMGPISDDHPTLAADVIFQKNTIESLSDLSVNDEVFDVSQLNATGGVLLACHLLSKPTDNSTKASFNKDVRSSRDIPSHSEDRVRTHSMRSLKTKQNNDEKSAKISGGGEIRLNCEPESKNNFNFEVFEFHGSTDKIKPSEFEVGVVEGESVQVSRTPNRDSDLRKVKTGGDTKKPKRKANKSSSMKTQRKLAYETPDGKKDEVHASPQCMSYNRSRSGRLLMPTLEFWRNQRAIYDEDGTITRIEEGRLPKQQSKGSSSSLQRKRKRSR